MSQLFGSATTETELLWRFVGSVQAIAEMASPPRLITATKAIENLKAKLGELDENVERIRSARRSEIEKVPA